MSLPKIAQQSMYKWFSLNIIIIIIIIIIYYYYYLLLFIIIRPIVICY